MKKQKVADFLYGLTTFLALILVVASIYDGLAIWRIVLYSLTFVFSAAGFIVSKLERRNKDSN